MLGVAGSTLLVVDDEPLLSLTFAILLRRAGACVFTAENGREALQIAERECIHTMLCDRQMPVMDGLTLLRTMHDRGISVPSLLFVTGLEHENADELDRMQVKRLLSKPIQPVLLLEAVADVLSRCNPASSTHDASPHMEPVIWDGSTTLLRAPQCPAIPERAQARGAQLPSSPTTVSSGPHPAQ